MVTRKNFIDRKAWHAARVQSDQHVKDAIARPVPTNVFDYFVQMIGIAPAEGSFTQLPLETKCGADCKGAIDAAAAFIAFGDKASPAMREEIVDSLESIIETYYFG